MVRAERGLEGNLARGQQENTRVLDESVRAANRVGRNNLMDMWIARTPQEFVRTWASPDRIEKGPNCSRTLFLHRGERIQGLNVYAHMINEMKHRCDISIMIVDGNVRDYAIQGANSGQQLR